MALDYVKETEAVDVGWDGSLVREEVVAATGACYVAGLAARKAVGIDSAVDSIALAARMVVGPIGSADTARCKEDIGSAAVLRRRVGEDTGCLSTAAAGHRNLGPGSLGWDRAALDSRHHYYAASPGTLSVSLCPSQRAC
jgi:hypothetical protein